MFEYVTDLKLNINYFIIVNFNIYAITHFTPKSPLEPHLM